MARLSLLLCLLLPVVVRVVRGEGVLSMLNKREQHSQFAELLRSTGGLPQTYLDNFVTVFAPSNDAMAAYEGPKDESFLLNHMVSAFPKADLQKPEVEVNSAVSREDLGERLTSILPGHPPLWIRPISKLVKSSGQGKSVLYVNQARVKFVYQLSSSDGKKQFLYLIDSVLAPLVPSSPEDKQDFVDIKAADLLLHPKKFRLGGHSVEKFASRVASLGMDLFPQLASYGKFTFFLPVDSAFESLQAGLIDEQVVRAHIVPNELLFSHPVKRRSQSVATLQYNSTRGSLALRVMAKLFSKDGATMVESQTVVGTKQHGRGTVEAEVLLSDIPVQNGVVHLISKPLVIMASTLWEHLDPAKPNNMRFKTFAEYVHRSPLLSAKINSANRLSGTLFIPTNEAFKLLGGDRINETISADLERILGLHFLDQTLQTDDIRIIEPQDDSGMYSQPAGSPSGSSSRLWMWQQQDGALQVDGGGVQAAVVEANVGASNGVIHSIDRVLGVPVESMYEKLARDPMMTKTYALGNQEHFNDDLKKRDEQFTYLVPTDKAWAAVKDDMATAHKVLFMGEYFYQSEKVLKRHLKVGGSHSLSNLVAKGKLDVMRGPAITVTETLQGGAPVTLVSYDGIEARVVRGDLQCTNGYIHLIDRVIIKRRDVTLGRAGGILPSVLAISLAWILSCLII